MSIPVRSIARLLALLALGAAGPAAAQSTSDGRAWTDPPARGAAVDPAPEAPKAAEAEKPPAAVATAEHRTASSESRAASSKPRVTAASLRAVSPKRRVAAIRRQPVAVARLHAAPVRIVHARMPDPRRVRYSFVPPPPAVFDEDPRARRIRQAEAAGYLVVRRSTVAAPDGRFLYGYRPYTVDDEIDD
jgi:hypothetical protein